MPLLFMASLFRITRYASRRRHGAQRHVFRHDGLMLPSFRHARLSRFFAYFPAATFVFRRCRCPFRIFAAIVFAELAYAAATAFRAAADDIFLAATTPLISPMLFSADSLIFSVIR